MQKLLRDLAQELRLAHKRVTAWLAAALPMLVYAHDNSQELQSWVPPQYFHKVMIGLGFVIFISHLLAVARAKQQGAGI